MARKKAKSEAKSEAPKKIKPISLNILEIAKRLQKLEQTSGGGDHSALANKSDIATEFNTTTAYTAGCFVYHEGKLYQFNADHAAGAWDPTDVVLANVTDQVVSNKAAIDGLTASEVAYGDGTVKGAIDDLGDDVDTLNSGVGTLGSTIAEVTADGIKTYSQLIDELFPYRSRLYRLEIDPNIFYPATAIRYGCVSTNNNDDVSLRSITLKETGSTYKATTINASTNVVSTSDVSSTVPSSGVKVRLVKTLMS